MNKRLDFFVVGAAKSGTTALHDILNQHPKVSLPTIKETNYFALKGQQVSFDGPLDDQTINKFSITCAEAYEQQFEDAELYGEVCPLYLYSESAPKNIHQHNPNAKIIIVLRNPIDRAYSNYLHLVRDGREQCDFHDAFAKSPVRIANNWEWFWDIAGQGLYVAQLQRYFELFPRRNIMIVEYKHFVTSQTQVVSDIYDFLGVNPVASVSVESNVSGAPVGILAPIHRFIFSPGVFNDALRWLVPTGLRKYLGTRFKAILTRKRELSVTDKQQLHQFYRSEIEQLVGLLGDDFNGWLDRK